MNPNEHSLDEGRSQGWFSRIDLRPEAGTDEKLAPLMGDGYRQHQLIWRLFADPQVTQRDFLFRSIEGGDLPGYYLVSARQPQDRDGIWQVRSKAYAPHLQAGETLLFSLCANPVVTRKSSPRGPSHRHDVVMDAKRTAAEVDVQEIGAAWLRARAGRLGFQVDQVVVDGYRPHQHVKGETTIQFSTLDFSGRLTVSDPQALTRTLFQGIGPAKGFGCGLLLVRRS